MPVSIIGYTRSGGSGSIGSESLSICQKAKSKTVSNSFKNITYVSTGEDFVEFAKKHNIVFTTSFDESSSTTVFHFVVPEDFPYFIVQTRVICNFSGGNLFPISSQIILFEPGEFAPESGIRINYPELDFQFVEDDGYRKLLERDYKELENLCRTQSLKSIYILTGSIIEGILDYYLQSKMPQSLQTYEEVIYQDSKRESNDVSRWPFYQKLIVAEKLSIITSQMRGAFKEIQIHRNVVHISYELVNEFEIDISYVNRLLSLLQKIGDHLSNT